MVTSLESTTMRPRRPRASFGKTSQTRYDWTVLKCWCIHCLAKRYPLLAFSVCAPQHATLTCCIWLHLWPQNTSVLVLTSNLALNVNNTVNTRIDLVFDGPCASPLAFSGPVQNGVIPYFVTWDATQSCCPVSVLPACSALMCACLLSSWPARRHAALPA